MPPMSNRLVTLVGIAAIAGAVWFAAAGRTRPAAPPGTGATTPMVAWVATAHQRGIVGYRDPAVAIAPGGRLIAYSEGRVLRVRPIGDGVDVSTATADGQVRHLAWIDDRRLVFEDGEAPLRWRLHEIGVGTRPLWPSATLEGTGTTNGTTLEANALRQLSPSPDGAWLAGMVAGREGPELWRVRLDGQELWRSPIAGGRASWPAWAAATEIACVLSTRDGDGISSPCGEPPLTTVPSLRIVGPIAFAPGGETIYAAAANGRGFVDLWRIDRATGRARQVSFTARDSYGPSVARDGTVVYRTQEYRTTLAELTDGVTRPLTAFQAETPFWHPTEPRLSMTFGSWRRQIDDANYPDIAQEVGVIDLGGDLPAEAPSEVVADSASEDQGMAWSPNARWIAFHSHRDMSDDVWLRPASGRVLDRRITMLGRGAEVGWPRWAPDGKTLLLDGTKDGRSVMFTLGLDQDTGQVTSDLREIGAPGFEITHGEWLPDGRRLVAIAKDGPGRHAVLLVPAAGGAATVLHRFESEHDFPGLAVTPDGASFTFVAPGTDGHFQLFSRAVSGGPVRQLTSDPIDKSQPAWSPDGRRLAFTAWRYDATIWLMRP